VSGLKKILCISVIASCLFAVGHSYSHSARYSTIIGSQGVRAKLECIHDVNSGIEDSADVLIFGSSRTGSMFKDKVLTRVATEYSGQSTLVKNLNIPGGDVSLSYQFLKEYLQNNPAPEVVYTEVMRVKQQVSHVSYINRAFSSLSDWDLTNDLLKNTNDGRSSVFRVADFSKVMIDKNDKYLSKLLVTKHKVKVSVEEPCKYFTREVTDGFQEKAIKLDAVRRQKKFENRFARIVEDTISQKSKAVSIRKETNSKAQERALKRHRTKTGKDWENKPAEDWGYDSAEAQRQLYYYQKISDLSKTYGFKLVLFRPYGLYEPEHDADKLKQYEAMFEHDILSPPYDFVKLSFPYYIDPNHVGRQSSSLFAYWLAEDIVERLSQ